ncbi:tripartite motif-containing protein 5-like [Mytilus trossulus]|uniref:tripartite motif-containing protein 5-like n=1 Tax=Mytilus trossulus TaxID=6551 RepID=UPI003007C879
MTDTEICAGCLRVNEREIAVSWCNDCGEPVCRTCDKAHRRFAVPHDVIGIKDISNVSKAITKVCREHTGQKLIFFCVIHDKIVCHVCISESHKECDIYHIEKAAKGIKDSSAIHDLKQRIYNQKYTIEKVKEKYHELSSKIDQDKEQQQERLAIEDRLNRLEKNIDDHYNQGGEKVSSSTEHLKSLAQTANTHLQDIEKAETEESEENLFHLVKLLDTSQLSNEENLQLLENDISNMSLQFIPENFIENIDAMLTELWKDSQTTSLKSQHSVNKTRQSQLRVDLEEQQSLEKTGIYHAGKSSKFYACCFSEDNKVGIIEKQSVRDEHPSPFTTTTIYLRIINLKDCKSHAFQLDCKYNSICKDTICWFDRNNILIVQNDSVHIIDLELEDIYRTINVIRYHYGQYPANG